MPLFLISLRGSSLTHPMELKIQCGCGTKYKFDVEPINGRMPMRVECPSCGADGTTDANQVLAQKLPQTYPASSSPGPAMAVAAAPTAPAVRLAASPRLSEGAAPAAQSGVGESSRMGQPRSLLERTTFFVKERVAVLKLTDTYDILDPVTGQPIGIAKEEPPTWAKWLRLVVEKGKLPTAVNVYEAEGRPPVLSMRRGFTFLRSKIQVVAGDGRSLGFFRSKLISLGGGFHVFDATEQQVAEVKGNWKGVGFQVPQQERPRNRGRHQKMVRPRERTFFHRGQLHHYPHGPRQCRRG